ncbi:hypothetical protein OESDEN_16437 [Oesophagostomum dentatum]|uniref:Uncharacterized protein n=1 Tax=Oesophagostomum dentatum TaxID=61180 RepID=A0A0B1SEV9_OESDE|nr:hypothetical protein OESDEN_16437 [Oesophagostomum dentatum]
MQFRLLITIAVIILALVILDCSAKPHRHDRSNSFEGFGLQNGGGGLYDSGYGGGVQPVGVGVPAVGIGVPGVVSVG